MHDAKTVQRFIELRVQGQSFVRIAQELGVSKPTLSTGRLLTHIESLRRQLRREAGPMQFVTSVDVIPENEYADRIQVWNP